MKKISIISTIAISIIAIISTLIIIFRPRKDVLDWDYIYENIENNWLR
jgi:hypothetical protein